MPRSFSFSRGLVGFLCPALLLLVADCVSGQTAIVAPRDPNAVALAGQSLQALAGSTTLTDITLQASASFIAGSDQEMGPATLAALRNQQSRVTLSLTNGQRTEIRSGPAGEWIDAEGVAHAMALHNCWSDAAWFYPGMSFQALSNDPGLGLAYVGPEVKNGLSVIHLRLFRAVPSGLTGADATVLMLSAEDLYLDATSLLPLFLDFNVHPDTDYTFNIPVEIAFVGYQKMGGIAVPAQIQKSLNGTLLLSLSVGSAAVNSGLPPSEFGLTATTGGAQ
jgi:hypothetical protein